MNISRKSGLYIHIPFCKSKCGYCDFYSIEDSSLTNRFISALLVEFKITASQIKLKDQFDTIYIGGGTPSLLDKFQINDIINTISKYYNLDKDCEITIEVNPGTVDPNQLKQLSDLGINRISIGVQSFIPNELSVLDRSHTVEDSINAINYCQQVGFNNINLDLIFALPNQTIDDWKFTLKKALSFTPEHFSVYNLTYEKDTPFYKYLMEGRIQCHDEDKEVEFYTMAHQLLTDFGYKHYEVSNYAKSDTFYSRHNYKYWQHVPYLGFGPSAHSFWENTRWANIRSVHDYVSKLDQKELPRSFKEKLKTHQLISEHIFLALRTYQGISLVDFERHFGINFLNKFVRETKELIENKLAVIYNDYFKLTEKGMLICDEILLKFTVDQ
jgi:oxygen-independent coproporphyrinogen-3 oxidase